MRNLKRTISLLTVIALAAGFGILPAFAAPNNSDLSAEYLADQTLANATKPEDFARFFDYDIATYSSLDAVTMKATGAGGDIIINFADETIYYGAGFNSEKAPAFVSFDGGTKWSALKFSIGESAAEPADFSKNLNKESVIWLTTAIDPKTKQPQKAVAATKTDGVDNDDAIAAADTYKFTKINARPKLDKWSVTYNPKLPENMTANDYYANGSTGAYWSLVNNGGTQKLAGIQIVYSADKKNPAGTVETGVAPWGVFDSTGVSTVVAPANPAKADKHVFLIRTAANNNTAGSKAKKVSVSSLAKAPNLKIDYKRGSIKLKADMVWGEVALVPQWKEGAPKTDPKNNAELDEDGNVIFTNDVSWFEPTDNKVTKKGDKLTTEGVLLKGKDWDYYGEVLGVRMVGTAKKPASAVQPISVADYADIYETAVGLTIKGTSIKLPKGYEAAPLANAGKADTKWTGTIKTDKAGDFAVRLKNTAKYNAKTNATTGNVVSENLLLSVLVGKDSKGKAAITTAAFMREIKGTRTGSAATKAVYVTNAASLISAAKIDNENYTADNDAVVTIGLVATGTSLATANLVVEPATADAVINGSDLVVTIPKEVTENGTITVTFKDTATPAYDNFYAPTITINYTVENKKIADSLKADVESLINGVSAGGTGAAVTQNSVKLLAETALSGGNLLFESNANGSAAKNSKVTVAIDNFTAATVGATAAASKDGKFDIVVTITRGDYETTVSKKSIAIPHGVA